MRRTTILLAACLLLAGAAVGCTSEKSQAEIQKECQAALTSSATKTNRPDECEGLSQDDYDTLLMSWTLTDNGWVDDDGNVDMGKLLDDATTTP